MLICCAICLLLREFYDVEHVNEALPKANSLFERSILRNMKCSAFRFICKYLRSKYYCLNLPQS